MAHSLTRRLALAFVGGCLGGALRIGVGLVWHNADIPWAVLLINLLGSFAIGVVGALWGAHAGWWPFLGPGLLGGFTTFSAVAALAWITSQSIVTSVVVLACTLVACTLAARWGLSLGERVRGAE